MGDIVYNIMQMLLTVHFTPLSMPFTPLTVHFTLLSTPFTLLTVCFTPLSTHFTPLSTHFALLTVYFIDLTERFILHKVRFMALELSKKTLLSSTQSRMTKHWESGLGKWIGKNSKYLNNHFTANTHSNFCHPRRGTFKIKPS